jgi:hypothetical protein
MLNDRFIVKQCDQGGKSRTNGFRNLAQPILQRQRTGGRAGQQRENIGSGGPNMRFPRTRFDLWCLAWHKPIHGTSLELTQTLTAEFWSCLNSRINFAKMSNPPRRILKIFPTARSKVAGRFTCRNNSHVPIFSPIDLPTLFTRALGCV